MVNSNKQSGMTFLGVVMILCMVAFFALVVLKVAPLYVEYGAISSALDGLVESGAGKKGKKEMIKRLDGQFNIEDVKSISEKDVLIEKEGNAWKVTAEYEARTSLFSNIGVFISFKKEVEVPK